MRDLKVRLPYAIFGILVAVFFSILTFPAFEVFGQIIPRSCSDAKEQNVTNIDGSTGDGIYTIDPDEGGNSPPFQVYCDMTTDGGGWTLVAWDPVTYENDQNGHTNIDFDHDVNQIGNPSNYHPTQLNANTYYLGCDRFNLLQTVSNETRVIVANNDDDNDPRVYDMLWHHDFNCDYNQAHERPDRMITDGNSFYPKQSENPGDLWGYIASNYIHFGNAIFYQSKPDELGGHHDVSYSMYPTIDWDNQNDDSGWSDNPQDNSDIQAAYAIFLRGNNQIEWWYVQNRKYEDGREFNKVNFTMKDEANNYILEEVLASMELYDPDGNMIQPTSSGYGNPYKTVAGGYDANNGRWYFGDSFYDENYYYINFNAPLKMGNYHLIVTDNSGNQYEAYQYFDSVKSIPQISSETICAFKDNEGNLFWKWEIPSEKFLNVSTSIRTWVDGFSADRSLLGEIYMKVPTHMGWAFVPANLLQQLEQLNPAVLEIGLHVRSNDNNNRYYTNNLNWEEANACGCDVNADQKTGLIEAIHALQVVAGVR